MKFLRWTGGFIVVMFIGLIALFFSLPLFNDFKTTGSLKLPGLKNRVTVQRDEKGMAYIRADNIDDLLMAQGFVTAQDRLFQMQLSRLFAQGRISELAGEAAKDLDIRMRTIGIHRMAEKQASILNPVTAARIQKYVDGINAFIDTCPDDIHLEFKLAGLQPEKWKIEDSLGLVYYMGYSTAANISTEIIAQRLLEIIGYEKAVQIMPLNFNPDNETDPGTITLPSKESLSQLDTGIKELIAFTGDRQLRPGSNNWAISPTLSTSGKAILAGDPHLDTRILPGVWYPIGLITKKFRAIGSQIAGIPGMAIGRTDHIALAMTNSYGDMQDLYIETIDPHNPDNYLEGRKSIPFTIYNETLKIKDKKSPDGFKNYAFRIRSTKRGPILNGLLPGLKSDHPIALRFAPMESMTGELGLINLMAARSAKDLARHLKAIPMLCLNWVFADKDGNIGHQASGRIPVRKNGDGTFPYPVTDNIDNWHGWIPQDEMPGTLNPYKNWISTCNHKVIDSDYPYYYSSYFASSYRYRRVKQLMELTGKKSGDQFWQFQRDTKNLMAEKLAPVMARILIRFDDTRKLGQILSKWNYYDDLSAAAPAIFQVTYTGFAKKVFEDELGEDNAQILLNSWYFWEERLQQMVLKTDSPWFDNINTPDRKETMEDLFHEAAVEATHFLEKTLGTDPFNWQWGQIHTLDLVNPLARKGRFKDILGSGPLPMAGSGQTLYRGMYNYKNPFKITHSAALRMVVDFNDDDKITAVIPGGITGRTFHPHQKDQIDEFMSGEKSYWWFSDREIDRHTRSRLELTP